MSHSSTALSSNIYVFGGLSDENTKTEISTIERLDVASNVWKTIKTRGFKATKVPSVCVISPTQILIFGGYSKDQGGTKSDVLIFNTEKKSARLIGKAPLKFMSHSNQSYIAEGQTVLAMVEHAEEVSYFVRLNAATK